MGIEINLEDISAFILLAIGGAALGAGLPWLTEGYTDMQQIEALGALGQVAAEEQYSQATETFSRGVYATIGGIIFILTGVAYDISSDIQKKMDELA